MEGNNLVNPRSEESQRGVASIFQKTFLRYLPLLLSCISLQYANPDAKLLTDNAVAWHAFLVALLFAVIASCKINLASTNKSELPITINDITQPVSNTTTSTCIFLISVFLALFFLLYILWPLFAWFSLCSPLFLFYPILYQKAAEWCGHGGISNPALIQPIFHPPDQQAEAASQAFNDTPTHDSNVKTIYELYADIFRG